MSLAATVKAMAAAGCSAEQIADVVARIDEERRAKARVGNAERQRRWREAHPRNANNAVMGRDEALSGVTQRDERDSRARSISSSLPSLRSEENVTSSRASLSRSPIDSDFDRFKSAYPRREGSNPWKPARDKFALKVKAGADPEAIIAGAEAYARSMAGSEPRFVAQAVTWLTQERWSDDHIAPPRGPPLAARKNGNAQVCEELINELFPDEDAGVFGQEAGFGAERPGDKARPEASGDAARLLPAIVRPRREQQDLSGGDSSNVVAISR